MDMATLEEKESGDPFFQIKLIFVAALTILMPVQVQAINDIQRYDAEIDRIERLHGPYSLELTEELQGLSLAYKNKVDINSASRALDRAMFITKINFGLHTDKQMPYLLNKISLWEGEEEKNPHNHWIFLSDELNGAYTYLNSLCKRRRGRIDLNNDFIINQTCPDATRMNYDMKSRLWLKIEQEGMTFPEKWGHWLKRISGQDY